MSASPSKGAEARLVAAKLSAVGVSVGCIAPSKLANWFEGQEGAAVFDTDAGRFDILFLPRGRTFDPLRVAVKQIEGGYRYSIESALPGRPLKIESPRRIYFSPHGNALVVTRDAELLPRIVSALEHR